MNFYDSILVTSLKIAPSPNLDEIRDSRNRSIEESPAAYAAT